ncbi:MAG TPA: hypothetical protein VMZ06_00720 [Candidatus Bathyarchaeia archaeon]|nr:hypothetical protein [Candidatus Bathyarchaeia archaeon]
MAGLMYDALLVAGATAVCVTFGLLFWLYGRLKEGARRPVNPNPLQNMAELSILFQTMRGLVREQKMLARDFNHSLDAKVEAVREAVRQVLGGYEQLMQMQKALKTQLEHSLPKREITAEETGEDDLPALRAIAAPEAADLIDNWRVQLPDAEATEDVPAEAALDRAASNPAPSREARNALLNMGEPLAPFSAPVEPEAGEPASQPAGSDDQAPTAPSNGTAALRSRVYKYHDAGMSISAISQELGLGKGEIRLMLSLRDK